MPIVFFKMYRNDYPLNYIWRKALVWRKVFFLWAKTMGDVMDSTLMHINNLPRPYSTPNRSKNTVALLSNTLVIVRSLFNGRCEEYEGDPK